MNIRARYGTQLILAVIAITWRPRIHAAKCSIHMTFHIVSFVNFSGWLCILNLEKHFLCLCLCSLTVLDNSLHFWSNIPSVGLVMLQLYF